MRLIGCLYKSWMYACWQHVHISGGSRQRSFLGDCAVFSTAAVLGRNSRLGTRPAGARARRPASRAAPSGSCRPAAAPAVCPPPGAPAPAAPGPPATAPPVSEENGPAISSSSCCLQWRQTCRTPICHKCRIVKAEAACWMWQLLLLACLAKPPHGDSTPWLALAIRECRCHSNGIRRFRTWCCCMSDARPEAHRLHSAAEPTRNSGSGGGCPASAAALWLGSAPAPRKATSVSY